MDQTITQKTQLEDSIKSTLAEVDRLRALVFEICRTKEIDMHSPIFKVPIQELSISGLIKFAAILERLI